MLQESCLIAMIRGGDSIRRLSSGVIGQEFLYIPAIFYGPGADELLILQPVTKTVPVSSPEHHSILLWRLNTIGTMLDAFWAAPPVSRYVCYFSPSAHSSRQRFLMLTRQDYHSHYVRRVSSSSHQPSRDETRCMVLAIRLQVPA